MKKYTRILYPWIKLVLPQGHMPRTIVIKTLVISSLSVFLSSAMASGQVGTSADLSYSQTGAQRENGESNLLAIFQQAVIDELNDRPLLARKSYDMLKSTELQSQIAVPSAVNLVALGRFEAAKVAFEQLIMSNDARERDYAHLWSLWLTARTHTGTSKELKNKLNKIASEIKVNSVNQKIIVDLYAGKTSVEAVFKTVENTSIISDELRRDSITEATFFVGGYLRYVQKDNHKALHVFEQKQDQLSSRSLERPLIQRSIAALNTTRN